MVPISLTEFTKVGRFYDKPEAMKYQSHPVIGEVIEIVRLAKEKVYLGEWSEEEYLEFSNAISFMRLYHVHLVYPVVHKILEQPWETICQELDKIKSRNFFDETIVYENKIKLLVQFFIQVKGKFSQTINFEYIGLKRNTLLTLEEKIIMYETVLKNLEEHNANTNKLRKIIYQWIEFYFAGTIIEKELLQLIEPMIQGERKSLVKDIARFQYEKGGKNISQQYYKYQGDMAKMKKHTGGYHYLYK